ncbi:hypothetical protein ACFX15_012089 [Malus domestica]
MQGNMRKAGKENKSKRKKNLILQLWNKIWLMIQTITLMPWRVYSEDDEGGKKHECFPEFNEKTDIKNLTLTLGLVFRVHVQFKLAFIMYSLVNGFGEIHFPRNEKLKVTAMCANGCLWKYYAGKMYGSNSI